MSDLKGGGVQHVSIVMAEELLRRGYAVDFVVDANSGGARDRVPAGVRVIECPRRSKIRARLTLLRRMPATAARILYPALLGQRPLLTLHQLIAYIDYLADRPPDVLITTTPDRSIQAIFAARVTGAPTRVIATERVTPSYVMAARKRRSKNARYWQRRRRIVHASYARAHAVVAVSEALGRDLARTSGLNPANIRTIYNPVVAPDIDRRMARAPAHAWFEPGQPPLILAAGRLVAEKDFATLIDAFALVAAKREAHLMILGEGEQRASLAAQIESLGLNARVALPGWHDNPYAAMSRADVFVLSSISEGLPGSLIQAIASGCPAVATDCPNGPREILADGRYGELVAVRDPQMLARAVMTTLDAPPDRAALKKRGEDFTVGKITDQYERLMWE